MFLTGEVTVDLVPGLSGLAGARDGEIDLAGSEALSRHGGRGRVTELSARSVSHFCLPLEHFFRASRREVR